MTIRRRMGALARAAATSLAGGAVRRLPERILVGVARQLADTRPLRPEPGWQFRHSAERPGRRAELRRYLVKEARRRRSQTRLRLRWYDDLALEISPLNDLGYAVYAGGAHEPNELAFLADVLEEGMVVIDGGANEGLYSLFASNRVGHSGCVLAVEPSPREVEVLRRNLDLNGAANVRIETVALAEQSGRALLAVAETEHAGHNALGDRVANPLVAATAHITVETCTIDSLVRAADVERVDLIKLDLEGSELRALRGATETLERFSPVLLIEANEEALAHQGSSKRELVATLEELDYVVWAFDPASARLRRATSPRSLSDNVVAAPAGWLPPAAWQEVGHDGDTPYLSVVVVSRNDDHGGDLLDRMQIFVNALAAQSARFSISLELILVEWNAPADRPRLHDAIVWPEADTFEARIIEVPPEVHAQFVLGDRLPLFQMIGKNVGIRRARAPFVLATNVDVLLSDTLMRSLAARQLRDGVVYVAARHDVDARLDPFAPVAEQLADCARHVIRVSSRRGTRDLRTGEFFPIYGRLSLLPGPMSRWSKVFVFAGPVLGNAASRRIRTGAYLTARGVRSPRRAFNRLRRTVPVVRAKTRHGLREPIDHSIAGLRGRLRLLRAVWLQQKAIVPLHTNACGDFTLLSRDGWSRLRGYCELPMHSLHLDSLLLYEAHYRGFKQRTLRGPVYHLEHESGWKPGAHEAWLEEQRRRGIPHLSNTAIADVVIEMYRAGGSVMPANPPNWGLGDVPLEEVLVRERAPLARARRQ